MKSKTDFESDADYYEYIRVWLIGIMMQGMVSRYGTDMNVQSALIQCQNYAQDTIRQLKKKKD